MKTRHLVLPLRFGARNKADALQAQACRTDAQAPRPGERMAKRCCGVVVISRADDETADFAADPVVLATYSTVPGHWDALELAA